LYGDYYETINRKKVGIDEMETWDKAINMIQTFKVNMWVDNSGLITKTNVVVIWDMSKLVEESGDELIMVPGLDASSMQKLSMSYSLSMRPITDDVKVETPTEYTTIQEFGQKITKNFYEIDENTESSEGRDLRRRSDVYMLVNGSYQYAVEHEGKLPAGIPSGEKNKKYIGSGRGMVNLGVLVPTYLPEIPVDPAGGTPENTGYMIYKDGDILVVEAVSEVNPEDKIVVKR